MENTTLNFVCKEKMSVAAIHNPAYIPNPGDIVQIENVYLAQPTFSEEKRIALIRYRVKKEPYEIMFLPMRKETKISVAVQYIDEISETALGKDKGQGTG
jgi:hypothetical protein